MVDIHLLTDDQLKARLIQYGVKPGPIVASTRALYEKKLHRLMERPAQTSQHKVNGTVETGQYSDSEEDAEEDKESESEQFGSETVAQRESIKTASRIGTSCQSRGFYPQCFLPSAGWVNVHREGVSLNPFHQGTTLEIVSRTGCSDFCHTVLSSFQFFSQSFFSPFVVELAHIAPRDYVELYYIAITDLFLVTCCLVLCNLQGKSRHKSSDTSKNGSLDQTGSPCRSFSITQMVEEIETRFSPQSKHTETERRSSYNNEHSIKTRTLQDFTRLNKDTMTGRSLCLMSPSSHQKQTVTEPVSDVLTEMFPDCAKTPTGIYATKRRPIKGAAGRPVQYKYPEMPLSSPITLARQEIQQRLVPLWVQIVVFLLMACLLFLIYSSMEEPLSNPFSALLDGLQEVPGLISSRQDTPAA